MPNIQRSVVLIKLELLNCKKDMPSYGNSAALEELLTSVQDFFFNLSLRKESKFTTWV